MASAGGFRLPLSWPRDLRQRYPKAPEGVAETYARGMITAAGERGPVMARTAYAALSLPEDARTGARTSPGRPCAGLSL